MNEQSLLAGIFIGAIGLACFIGLLKTIAWVLDVNEQFTQLKAAIRDLECAAHDHKKKK